MSFVSTKMICDKCNCDFEMAFQVPDRKVTVYPDENIYVIGTCEKDYETFTLSCSCKQCNHIISKSYSKQEFDNLKYSVLD